MLCKIVSVTGKKRDGSVPVYLNVYDLTPINGYAYWVGLGIYHSGVQGGLSLAFELTEGKPKNVLGFPLGVVDLWPFCDRSSWGCCEIFELQFAKSANCKEE